MLPILGEVALSHRKRRNVSQHRHEPDDLFSAFGPWTTSVADRLPFVAVFFGSLAAFFAHLRYIE